MYAKLLLQHNFWLEVGYARLIFSILFIFLQLWVKRTISKFFSIYM